MRQLSDIKNHDYARIQEEDFNIIRDTATGTYVEVGTFHGASAYAAAENAEIIYTIDVYDWKPKVWHNTDNIRFKKMTAVDFIAGEVFYPLNLGIDILFIDGSHEFDYVRKDIESLEPYVKKGGIIMFHDYKKGSTGVYDAVNEYLEREKPERLSLPIEGKTSILKVRKV